MIIRSIIFLFSLVLLPVCLLSQNQIGEDSTIVMEVHFQLDSYRLSAGEKHKVDSLLEVIPLSILKNVGIYGHTDSLASQDYNRELSKRRVQSILAYLVYKGLDPLRVEADYYGEDNPKYDNGPATRARNRRCEIHLTIDPSLLPQPEARLTDFAFKTGDKIRIPNLNFVGNQAIPVAESFESLKDLLRVMQKYPDLKIELQGHVCCSDDQELSEARAKMVYDFLAGNGIPQSRMSHRGFSNSKPLFKERTEHDRAMNRRVEVYVESNTGRVAKVPEEDPKIDLRAPVLNVKFFPNKRRLYPSGDFMLGLIAEMMKKPSPLFYEFVIFDNINNSKLTNQRAAGIERALLDKRVNKSIFTVNTQSKYPGMRSSDNENLLMVKIYKK